MKNNKYLTIAIDGPAGSGKGEMAKLVSKKYDLINIGSGSFYRAYTYFLLQKFGVDNIENILKDNTAIDNLFKEFRVDYKNVDQKETVVLNGEDITDKLAQRQIVQFVSIVAQNVKVRENLNNIFLQFSNTNCIMEGRDIGTCVFPDADLKIFLDADIEIRAKRRYEQNKENNLDISYEQCLENLKQRDYKDKTRKIGKLVLTQQHCLVDSTNLTIEQTFENICELVDQIIEDKQMQN